MKRTKYNPQQTSLEFKEPQEIQFKRTAKKSCFDVIQNTKDNIEKKFKENPPVLPNKKLLKWVEVYCPNCFLKIAVKLEQRHLYKQSQDIYNQDFKLIMIEVTKFLKKHGFDNNYEWLSREMQNDLLTIEKSL